MSKVIVTVKHTIPLMDYGNTIFEATQEIDISEGNDLGLWQVETTKDVRAALSLAILPLVESEVERCMSVLIKEANPDNWMRKNSKVYQWFRLAYPDVAIPAMGRIEQEKENEIRLRHPLMDLEASR